MVNIESYCSIRWILGWPCGQLMRPGKPYTSTFLALVIPSVTTPRVRPQWLIFNTLYGTICLASLIELDKAI
jgi:hypothetical protein